MRTAIFSSIVTATLFCFTALAKVEQRKTEFKEKLVLVQPREGFGREKAFLLIDVNNSPAIYPIIDRHVRCVPFSKHTKTEIQKHWPSHTRVLNFDRYTFECWRNGIWEPVSIDLQYKKDYCYLYRVNSKATKVSPWFKVSAIPPFSGYYKSKDGKLKLPIEIGIIDGPRDMSDCRMGPLSEKYTIPMSKGMCPHGVNP